jgi:hypothetical protein
MAMSSERPIELLAKVAEHVVDAPGREPWNYGWCLAEYRASPSAALEAPRGPVTIEPSARQRFEEAVGLLSRESAVRERWDLEELWGVVASRVAAAAETSDPKAQLTTDLDSIREADTNLILMAVANVVPPASPLLVADCVIGEAGDAFLRSVNEAAGSRPRCRPQILNALSKRYPRDHGPVVLAAYWTRAQAKLAVERAKEHLRTLLDVALLLETDPGSLGMHSLRGPTNRPGARGLIVHRPALEFAMRELGSEAELAAEVVVASREDTRSQIGWYSSDPVPIDGLLSDTERQNLVDRCVREASPVGRRVRLAGRWYAEAHWASDQVDAVLALGIALDALIGSRSGLPGRAMKERFAFLEPDPEQRSERARRYSEVFGVRSAIAHGSTSSALDESGFVRGISQDVVWTARRMLALDKLFAPTSDKQLDEVFEGLRWGTAQWKTVSLDDS